MQFWYAGILRPLLFGWFGFLCVMHLAAQASVPNGNAPPPQTPSAVAATIRGQVADATGALIPSAKITVTTPAGDDAASVLSDAFGGFLVRSIKLGDYVVRATSDGFAPFQSATLTLAANQMKRINIVMAIEADQQSVSKEQSKGAIVKGYPKDNEDGQVEYEVVMMVNGHTKDVSIGTAGNVLEIEEQIEMNVLSSSVKAAIEAKAGNGNVTKVESLTKNGSVVAYEAQVTINGKNIEIQVGPHGETLTHEE